MNDRYLEISRVVGMAIVAMILLSSCTTRTKVVKVVEKYEPDKPAEEVYIVDIASPRGRVVQEATTWLGTPYKLGSADKGVCTDCSGMVMGVYLAAVNIALPRTSYDMSVFCKPITAKEVKQGDLVFFATGSDPNRVSHVGIMIDNDRFIHASSKKGVTITHIDNTWFAPRIRGYGLVPGMK